MTNTKVWLALLIAPLLGGCQMGYLMKSGYGQMKLLSSRVPISEVLEKNNLSQKQKEKLLLAQQAREFSEKKLHLKPTKNYTSYVELGRSHVTYVVSAAQKWQLKHYQWDYPFMGKMPYKGFFDKKDAEIEEQSLQKENLDTYLRGASAYSTLGWFNDPILSSMLNYDDYDLVNLIIHETVHATLYIKHAADFNERLATFLGNKGAEQFYLQNEGPQSATLAKIKIENEDNNLFSTFISKELKELGEWYSAIPQDSRSENKREQRIRLIQERFNTELKPNLKTDSYKKFPEIKLNNARLLVYKTYMQDLSDFEKLYKLVGNDFASFIQKCKTLESSNDPEKELKNLISTLENT